MKYLNFIPIDFFTKNKSTVYSIKSHCIAIEGSAIEFDPLLDLTICKIDNNEVVIDVIKREEKERLQNANAYKEERREKYNEQGLSFDKFVEMLIENDTTGIENFRSKRDVIKLEIPKPK